jgi:hypothetical protein
MDLNPLRLVFVLSVLLTPPNLPLLTTQRTWKQSKQSSAPDIEQLGALEDEGEPFIAFADNPAAEAVGVTTKADGPDCTPFIDVDVRF